MNRLLLLTDAGQAARPLPDVVREAVAAGARSVLLRERQLDRAARAALAAQLRALLAPVGGQLVVAGTALTADAVHLAAADAVPQPRPRLVGRSCHSAAELAAAAGCDWVSLSPLHASASKPGYGPALGLAGFAALVPLSPAPVLALGGVRPRDVPGVLAAGAHGVAVMGAVMRAASPGAVVASYLEQLEAACSPASP